MPAPLAAAPATPEVKRLGQVISGRYLIQKLLGEGGMGAVYLAEHTHMKKHVALKLLHPEMMDNAEVSARFEREAMASAHIEHPNVAAATDFGKTDDGAYFLVLEYIEGTSLRDTLAEGQPLSVARALRITRQIALALERAHEAGIVHRDLKPENVMLVKKDGEPDFVKVLDFGIAKLVDGGASASADIAKRNGAANPVLTRLGTILGTPEYMAPEQALGEAISPAADLYGVGVMLYEMLTGKHPFDPPDRMAMLSFHIVAPVPLMRDRAPEVDVPAAVEAVVRCLLEKDAKKRYASARALVEAIESAASVSGLDVGATPLPPASQRGSLVEAPRAPGSVPPDAFAKTSFGLVAPGATLNADGSLSPAPSSARMLPSEAGESNGAAVGAVVEQVKARLRRLPRNALFALAAGVPLAFVLFVVVIVLLVRGPKPTDASTGDGTGAETAEAKAKLAPPDRVETAVALGPAALDALTKEYPEDFTLLRKLAVAQQAQGKSLDAIRTVRALLTANPPSATDDETVQLVMTIAAKGQGEADDAAFALLEGPLGERGVDALIELTAPGPGREIRDLRARASKSLAKPEVRAHASQSAAVLLEMKAADKCDAKHELLGRAKEHGDARILPALKQLKVTNGCRAGFRRVGDCWPCLRKDTALDDAVTAVEARAPAR
jgi:eukaryotic-like serine/threonine-protein kinase